MKKLLLIALIAVSPVTFANEFNKDLLIGTWQCKTDAVVKKDVIMKWNDTISFYKQGFYQNKSEVSYLIYNNEKMTNTETSLGLWELNDGLLQTIKKESLNFHSNNTKLAKKYEMAKHLQYHDFLINRKIEPVSKDKFILKLVEEQKNQNGILNDEYETCERIK